MFKINYAFNTNVVRISVLSTGAIH